MIDAGLDYQMSLLHLLCNDVFPYCLNLIFYTVHELTQTWIFNVVAFVVNFEFTNPIDIWKDIWRCFPLLLFHNVDGPAIRTISLDNSFSYESRNLSILCFIYSLWWKKRSKSLAEVSQSQSRPILDTANLVGLFSQFQALSKFFDVLFQSKDCVR